MEKREAQDRQGGTKPPVIESFGIYNVRASHGCHVADAKSRHFSAFEHPLNLDGHKFQMVRTGSMSDECSC